MKHEIFGISFENITEKANDVFTQIESGDELYYITKKTFKHEEEGLTFDYKYALVCMPTEVYTDEFPEGSYEYNLILCVMGNSMHQSELESMLDTCGYELDDVDLSDKDALDGLIPEIHSYGLSVSLGFMRIEGEHDIEEVADKTATILDGINTLRGFYLDKKWNMMGNNGWDILNCAINNQPMF